MTLNKDAKRDCNQQTTQQRRLKQSPIRTVTPLSI